MEGRISNEISSLLHYRVSHQKFNKISGCDEKQPVLCLSVSKKPNRFAFLLVPGGKSTSNHQVPLQHNKTYAVRLSIVNDLSTNQ